MATAIGIDFGLTRCGLAVVEDRGADGFFWEEAVLIETDKDKKFGERAWDLWGEIAEVVQRIKPYCVGLETFHPTYGGLVQRNLLKAQGCLEMMWTRERLIQEREWPPLSMLAPATVKKIVAGHGRASKSDMRAAVDETLTERAAGVGEVSVDEVDAAAVALVVLTNGKPI